jgi:general stress protein 26
MADETNREESIAKLNELIKDIEVAMMTTIDTDGTLRSRPMATQKAEFDGDLWFFTAGSSPKVNEIQREQQVNVSYSQPSRQRYVSVSGRAQLVFDRKKAEELWTPLMKAWFPQGLDDPDLALLRVSVEKAEYWDSPSGKLVAIAGFVKALATGQRIKPGDHDRVEMR